MPLNSVLHWSSSLSNVNFAAFTGNPVDYDIDWVRKMGLEVYVVVILTSLEAVNYTHRFWRRNERSKGE